MDGSSLAVPHMTPQTWHIAMPAEEPSTASTADGFDGRQECLLLLR
jgi:hypothetical protein